MASTTENNPVDTSELRRYLDDLMHRIEAGQLVCSIDDITPEVLGAVISFEKRAGAYVARINAQLLERWLTGEVAT